MGSAFQHSLLMLLASSVAIAAESAARAQDAPPDNQQGPEQDWDSGDPSDTVGIAGSKPPEEEATVPPEEWVPVPPPPPVMVLPPPVIVPPPPVPVPSPPPPAPGWVAPSPVAPPPTAGGTSYRPVSVTAPGQRYFVIASETLDVLIQRHGSRDEAWRIAMTKAYVIQPLNQGQGRYTPPLNRRLIYAPDCNRVPRTVETKILQPVAMPTINPSQTAAVLACTP